MTSDAPISGQMDRRRLAVLQCGGGYVWMNGLLKAEKDNKSPGDGDGRMNSGDRRRGDVAVVVVELCG